MDGVRAAKSRIVLTQKLEPKVRFEVSVRLRYIGRSGEPDYFAIAFYTRPSLLKCITHIGSHGKFDPLV